MRMPLLVFTAVLSLVFAGFGCRRAPEPLPPVTEPVVRDGALQAPVFTVALPRGVEGWIEERGQEEGDGGITVARLQNFPRQDGMERGRWFAIVRVGGQTEQAAFRAAYATARAGMLGGSSAVVGEGVLPDDEAAAGAGAARGYLVSRADGAVTDVRMYAFNDAALAEADAVVQSIVWR